jgi:diguanylate cyclase (GGDEF)-like protein
VTVKSHVSTDEQHPALLRPNFEGVTLSERATSAPLHASGDSDERTEAFANLNRHVLLMRGLGAALLIGGWAYFTLPRFGSAMFFADTIVFLILGAYAFVAAYTARRETIALEKKLRLSLIMRNMELEGGATRDDLTHLFNRAHFFDRLERELQTAKGVHRPLSVVVVDLNGIEEINRNHGYRTGDKVLATFGKFLLDQARASDVPARIGGDKFAIILPDTAEPAANAAVNRLLQALDKLSEFETADVSIKLTARAAASGYPWDADTVDSILQRAIEKSHALERA